MRTIVKGVHQLNSEEYKYCYYANLDASDKMVGRMRPDLVYYRSDHATSVEEEAKAVMLWDDDLEGARRLLGWALTFKEKRDPIAFFWVKKPHRNKGYGTILMKEVKTINPKPKVYPWSNTSGAFFSKFDLVVPEYAQNRLVKKPIVC